MSGSFKPPPTTIQRILSHIVEKELKQNDTLTTEAFSTVLPLVELERAVGKTNCLTIEAGRSRYVRIIRIGTTMPKDLEEAIGLTCIGCIHLEPTLSDEGAREMKCPVIDNMLSRK